MVFHRAPLEQKRSKENLSTGHQRLNPDRTCKRGNVVYTLHEGGTVCPPDDIAHEN